MDGLRQLSACMRALLATLLFGAVLPAAEIELAAPLTTLHPCPPPLPVGDRVLVASLFVPPDAPADLGVGAYVRDAHGSWHQRLHAARLTPGRHRLRLAVTADDPVVAEPGLEGWNAGDNAVASQAGLFFWSASASRARIVVESLIALPLTAAGPQAPLRPADPQLRQLEGLAMGTSGQLEARVRTGERFQLTLLPEPFPANPHDPEHFSLDAVITHEGGAEWAVPGFAWTPMVARDRGDREDILALGPERFALRFRPSLPGRYLVVLTGRWPAPGATASPAASRTPLRTPALAADASPTASSAHSHCVEVRFDLIATGAPWDDIVRVDPLDARFLSTGARLPAVAPATQPATKLAWPIGINLRSVNDTRSRDNKSTRLTPDRGTLAYEAYLDRLSAHGVDAIELWMAAWNVALEWRPDWPGYYGAGRYSDANAWRLDRILEMCEARGMRVNLVLNNHGQASPKTDREWQNHPYYQPNGGWLTQASELFTDARAFAMQDRVRRYVVARYADSPAILGWKLYSEVNLTAGYGQALRDWADRAGASFRALDPYGHPVALHWSGDYRTPDPLVCASPGLDYLCIDAYHRGQMPFPDLVARSIRGDPRSLGGFQKPILITEYGGNWSGAPDSQLIPEHRSAGFAGLVTGHAGCPMTWWYEWVDQRGHFQTYAALRAFLAGEDLRGLNAASTDALNANRPVWARAWVRPGRMLGYLYDPRWTDASAPPPPMSGLTLIAGTSIRAGRLHVTWWNPDSGEMTKGDDIEHPGGALTLRVPTFANHLAYKLWREEP